MLGDGANILRNNPVSVQILVQKLDYWPSQIVIFNFIFNQEWIIMLG